LKAIDLDIKSGEFVGIVGHSGAGKTTLLNLIGLMDRATEGSLSVLGHDTARRGVRLDALRRRNIGFVFQEFYLMPTLTATENVPLLADEPTGSLDTLTRDGILNLLLALNRDTGLTVIVATHDRSLESRFSRVVRLEDGEVV
jgi:ABC-type lipoprotein export system ATPase subunit